MEKVATFLSYFTIKDWFIIGTLFILVLCILEIRRLKKSIVQTIRQDLTPQLTLEIVMGQYIEDSGFYINNVGFFLAKEIRLQDAEVEVDDYGFKLRIILQFEGIDFLKPGEKRKLEFKVINKKGEFLADFTEKALPHLISPSFKIKVHYSNIEGLKLCSVFSKNQKKFNLEKIIYPPLEKH